MSIKQLPSKHASNTPTANRLELLYLFRYFHGDSDEAERVLIFYDTFFYPAVLQLFVS